MSRARWFAVVSLILGSLVLGLLAACGGDDDQADEPASPTTDLGTSVDEGTSGPVPTGCPIDAAAVADAVGIDLPEDPASPCRFADGVAAVTITVQGSQGEDFFETVKDQNGKQYDLVEDIDKGDRAYLLASDTRAETSVEIGDAGYLINLSGFDLAAAEMEEPALALVDAVLATT